MFSFIFVTIQWNVGETQGNSLTTVETTLLVVRLNRIFMVKDIIRIVGAFKKPVG